MNRITYEVDLLDDLHALFPEILYDNTLFSHDTNDRFGNTLSWMRYRISNLYPSVFSRARQSYLQNLASQRRNEYDDWMWLRRGDQPIVQRYHETAPVQAPRNPWSTTRVLDRNAINQIINNTMIDEILGNLIIPRQTVRANFFDSVPVRPTASEINLTTEIIESSLTVEANCAICQENESPRDVPGLSNGWRKLKICNHLFHKNCIDRWFENHVHCPICRADIRDFIRLQTPTSRPGVQSVGATAASGQNL
jgi:hypothetical protein